MVKIKSTQLELDILNLLEANREGLALYKLARMLNKDPSNIHKKLSKFIKHKIVLKIKSNVAIYRFSFNSKPIVYFEIECPKCKLVSIAEYYQGTKICPNKNCLTKGGKQTRYWINKNRIKRELYK